MFSDILAVDRRSWSEWVEVNRLLLFFASLPLPITSKLLLSICRVFSNSAFKPGGCTKRYVLYSLSFFLLPTLASRSDEDRSLSLLTPITALLPRKGVPRSKLSYTQEVTRLFPSSCWRWKG